MGGSGNLVNFDQWGCWILGYWDIEKFWGDVQICLIGVFL
jgi:hypothetical protein